MPQVPDQIDPIPPPGATDYRDPIDGTPRRISPYSFVAEIQGMKAPGAERRLQRGDSEVTIEAWKYMATFQGFNEYVRLAEMRQIAQAIDAKRGTDTSL